jgi:hypothetical protein
MSDMNGSVGGGTRLRVPRKPKLNSGSDNHPKRAKWYYQETEECPGCSRVKTWKTAMYTNPPDKEDRYYYGQSWCGGCW